jgi:hypothetical protein
MFSKTYELSLNRNYVSHWGMTHAIRELIQNALDSESPFIYEFITEGDTTTLRLYSEFANLPVRTLLLGTTSKANSPDSIGSFGEGYKIALLVLTRLGYDVDIRNNDKLWRPRFRHSKNFNEELLVIDETSSSTRHSGLTFLVHGLSESDVADVRKCCLKMQTDIGETKRTKYGDILLDRAGMLYVGSLFVCETGLRHSYNIHPQHLKLERDRQTVDGWDLKCITRDMWFDTGEHDRIAKMIEGEVPDVAYAEYSSPEMVKDACYRLFISKNPAGAIAVKTQEELTKAVAQGLTTVVVEHVYHSVLTRSSAYRSYSAAKAIKVKTPHELLTEWFDAHKFNMHEKCRAPFREIIEQSKAWKP